MQDKPMVSVIMATFNEPKLFIEASIASILNQTYSNLELLIADDSTNPETVKVINDFAASDSRVIVIRKAERMGFVNALNEALHLAKGDLIARMDGDDISVPQRFEIQLRYAAGHPEVDVFGGDMDIIDENNEKKSERHYPTTPAAIQRKFIFRSPFAHPTLMFKRKIIDAGFHYNPNYKKAEDIDFLMRLYKNGYAFGNTGEKLLRYRVVGNLQIKRSRDQWIYNHKARSENFIWSKPLFSSASWFASLLYQYVPESLVTYIYKRENTDKYVPLEDRGSMLRFISRVF